MTTKDKEKNSVLAKKDIVYLRSSKKGFFIENLKDILIADSADEFVEAIHTCLSDKIYADTVARNARILVEKKYDNITICKQLTWFYKALIQN